MGYQQQVFRLVKELTQEGSVIAIPRLFVSQLGSLNSAYFLSQLLYWSDKGARSDGFFYKTDRAWQAELGLSQYKLRKARGQLTELGLIETKVMRANGSPTIHYRVLEEGITKWIMKFSQEPTCSNCNIQPEVTEESLTETTTETTTLKDSFPPKSDNGKELHAQYFEAVQTALRLPPKLTKRQAGRCARLAKKIRESGYSVDETTKAGEYWWAQDWRGLKGDPPTDSMLTHRLQIMRATAAQVQRKWTRV